MQLRIAPVLIVAFSFWLLAFSFANAAWKLPVWGPPFGNLPLPLNASANPQIKNAGAVGGLLLTINGLFRSAWLDATEQVRIGDGAINDPDSTSALDVAGQIRIRGGNPGPNKVLKTSAVSGDTTGLASWVDWSDPVPWLEEGLGIKLYWNVLTKTYSVATASTTVVQNRITGDCPTQAINLVKWDGTVDCRDLVSSINNPPTSTSGLTVSGVGDLALVLNLSSSGGLTRSGNPASLIVNPPPAGSGLTLSNNYLQFATTSCSSSNVYWKYNSGTGQWNCGSPPPPRPPGSSVMYLMSMGTPPACPSPWVDALSGGVITEYAGSFYNNGRICLRNDNVICQTMYLNHTTGSTGCPSTASPPSCPGWTDAGLLSVYAPGTPNPPYCNRVRTCYKCN